MFGQHKHNTLLPYSMSTHSLSIFNGWFLLILSMIPAFSFAQSPQTVPYVDLEKYAGKWFEIASFPKWFQRNCTETTAQYTLTAKGCVIVENRCICDTLTRKESYIKGKAWVVKESGNAKLKVQFFWPFTGKYWIIALADDYSYAVVGHPNKKSLWILSRTPKMDEALYQQILVKIKEQGFEVEKLKRTKQSP